MAGSQFAPDATVVIQASDAVMATRLAEAAAAPITERIDVFGAINGHAGHLTAVATGSGSLKARLLTEGVERGIPCRTRDRRLLSIGEVIDHHDGRARIAEDRFAEIELPVADAVIGDRVVATCRDYHTADADGQVACIGSIVLSLESKAAGDKA